MYGVEQVLQMVLTVLDLPCRFMQGTGFHFRIMPLHSQDMARESVLLRHSRAICFSMVAAAQSVMLVFILVTDRLFMQVTQELELRFRAHIIVHQFVLHDI